MKKELHHEITIPDGVEVTLKERTLHVKGKEGELIRTFDTKSISLEVKGNLVILDHKKGTKREKKLLNTLAAHIENMIKGVQKKFTYKLKICYSHFPFTVDIQKTKASIKNFLGEKVSRVVSLPSDIDIQADKQFITISAIDKEKAGQAAANLERVTRVRGRDRRIFQDGLFLVEKAGKEI